MEAIWDRLHAHRTRLLDGFAKLGYLYGTRLDRLNGLGDRIATEEIGLCQKACDPPSASFVRLVFGERSKETYGGPVLLIGNGGGSWSDGLHARQAKQTAAIRYGGWLAAWQQARGLAEDEARYALVRLDRNHPLTLSITHISDRAFALSESFVILFVTPIRGGVTDEWGEGSQYIRLA